MSEALTKKQQKALAFKSKQKAKRRGEINGIADDVPEQDLVDDEESTGPVVKPSEGDKKVTKAKAVTEPESEKKQGKRKKTAWDEDEAEGESGEGADKPSKKSKKDVTQRFILFVGNLGFRTTKDRIEAVFRQALGETPSVRLLTNKAKPGSTMGPTSRGIAFIEFPNSTLLQQALKLHHTDIDGRRINVELTAGGGGSGQVRKEKIEARQGRLGEQREKRAEKEKEEGVAAEEGGEDEKGVSEVKDAGTGARAGGDGGVKMRGDRRIKAKPQGNDYGEHQQRDSRGPPRGGGGGGGGYGRGGGGDRGRGRGGYGGSSRGGSGGGRSRWQPTGANAQPVDKRA